MFRRLIFDVTFSTNRRVSGDHSFGPGLTAITGRNWTGKSLRLELIRYALFGSEALRGKSDDYQSLEVKLEFEVGGTGYVVTRNKKVLIEYEASALILATGHRAVNSKVTEILGFGLDVFDIACCVCQGEVERLGAMLPSERKRMVDSTIGLGALDEVAKVLAGEASELRQRAAGIREGASKPEEPVKPSDYVRSEYCARFVEDLRKDVQRLTKARMFLSMPVREPEEPVRPCEESLEELEACQRNRQATLDELNRIEGRLSALPPAPLFSPEWIREQLRVQQRYNFWKAKVEFLERYPLPLLTVEEIKAAEHVLHLHERAEERRKLWCRQFNLKQKGDHVCEKCHHKWPVARDELAEIEEELSDFSDLPDPLPPIVHDRRKLNVEKARRDAFESQRSVWEIVKSAEESPPPTIHWEDLEKARRGLEAAEERARLEAEIASLEVPPDRSTDLQAMRDYLTAVQRYSRDLTAYNAWQAEAEEARVSVANFSEAPDHLRRGEEQLREAQVYEKILGSYQVALRRYEASITLAGQLEHEAAQLALARKALAELRVRVKQQFTPLLARAASTLVQRMSAGAYSDIEIDDDFEIMLDGQALRTLSGAGKAIANLAVRLGLGMVLTRGMLPVLLADEVDAAMDGENAEATASCIRGLAGSLRQVILVSHKRLEADHYVEL